MIKKAAQHLRRGALVIYPTETAYAFGAVATSARAVRRIFVLKRRAKTKTLPVIVGSMAQAARYVRFSPEALSLARRFWPGPLTLVLPARSPRALARGLVHEGMLALRVPSHPIARSLARRVHGPIVSTSANLAGRGACYSIGEVVSQFRTLPPDILIVDAGTLPHRRPSTIVAFDPRARIVRQGAIRI
ncbi:threonylcarbamoyl-AMP synthase [Candidatus Uhrbacteria bacterium]|nr:threonylcarbamoyl-AMP synthase [Candidatus Uhrbacteria bacterium]